MLLYGSPEFALVTGTGRVGAAISPTAGEETFFGNPGFEVPADYLQRHIDGKKLKSQKIALGTAVNIWNNEEKGLSRLSLNLGVLGRYNKLTKGIKPGAGISGIAGPLTFGYAWSQDEYAYDPTLALPVFRYTTGMWSAGLFLKSFAFDYSDLQITSPGMSTIKIKLLTASLLLERWIFTLASRTEDSFRPKYDVKTKTLIAQQKKSDGFIGVQFAVHPKILLGAFYNYYLLNEIDLGLTLFAF